MSKLTGFRVFLAGVLLCASVAWAVSAWDLRGLKGEFRGIAKERVAFYRNVVQVVDGDDAAFDVVSVVTVTRKFGLVGKPSGKVTIYRRSDEPIEHGRGTIGHVRAPGDTDTEHEEGRHAEEENTGFFSGIQYFYEKVDGEWLNTESGQCSSEECQTEGRDAFERAGI